MSDQKNEWLRLATIGPHFLACTLIGFWLGRQIDKLVGTDYLWAAIMSLFGVAAGFINLFKELSIINKAEEEEKEAEMEQEASGEPENRN